MNNELSRLHKLSSEQKLRVEKGLQEIREGKVISNEEANRQAKEWLKSKLYLNKTERLK